MVVGMQVMSRITLVLAIASCAGMCIGDAASQELATNVYARALAVYDAERAERGDADRDDAFKSIRGGCFCSEVNMTNFMPFCEFVSNRFDAIVADWHTYETNDMVRYVTICGLGYSGFANYTNFLSKALVLYEADTNSCSWATIKHLHCIAGTRAQYYLDMNYETLAVGNMVRTIKRLAIANGDVKTANCCDHILSGDSKRECQDLIAIGDWIQ